MSKFEIAQADLTHDDDSAATVAMIDSYSQSPTANGAPLADDIKSRLIPGLRAHPGTVVFLARDDSEPIGVAVCFVGYSTFAGNRLLNIHDLAVVPSHAGKGVGRALLAAAEAYARERGFAKLTLECQENNTRAWSLYENVGFGTYELDPATGRALVMQKKL